MFEPPGWLYVDRLSLAILCSLLEIPSIDLEWSAFCLDHSNEAGRTSFKTGFQLGSPSLKVAMTNAYCDVTVCISCDCTKLETKLEIEKDLAESSKKTTCGFVIMA